MNLPPAFIPPPKPRPPRDAGNLIPPPATQRPNLPDATDPNRPDREEGGFPLIPREVQGPLGDLRLPSLGQLASQAWAWLNRKASELLRNWEDFDENNPYQRPNPINLTVGCVQTSSYDWTRCGDFPTKDANTVFNNMGGFSFTADNFSISCPSSTVSNGCGGGTESKTVTWKVSYTVGGTTVTKYWMNGWSHQGRANWSGSSTWKSGVSVKVNGTTPLQPPPLLVPKPNVERRPIPDTMEPLPEPIKPLPKRPPATQPKPPETEPLPEPENPPDPTPPQRPPYAPPATPDRMFPPTPVRVPSRTPLQPPRPVPDRFVPKQEPELGNDALVKPTPKPLPPTTPQDSVKIRDDLDPVGSPGQGPPPTLVGIATELGRMERKAEMMLRAPSVDVDGLVNRIKELLDAMTQPEPPVYPGGAYVLAPVCDGPQEPVKTIPYPATVGDAAAILARVDALADLAQASKDLRQPICHSKAVGQQLTVGFIEDRMGSWEDRPLRKTLSYRDQGGGTLESHTAGWVGFQFEAGPVQVLSIGKWGKVQVYTSTEQEGKRVIRHAAALAGYVPEDDPDHHWMHVTHTGGRIGKRGTMIVKPVGQGIAVRWRDGPSGPSFYKPEVS